MRQKKVERVKKYPKQIDVTEDNSATSICFVRFYGLFTFFRMLIFLFS